VTVTWTSLGNSVGRTVAIFSSIRCATVIALAPLRFATASVTAACVPVSRAWNRT
jgi:hypothetical protein